MTWNLKANLRGPAGYNATGAAQDAASVGAFLRSTAGPNDAGTAINEIAGLNVINFGAVGDGTTDDTAAIQACVNAAGPAGTVILPAKHFRISAPILLLDNTQLQGVSGEGSVLDTVTDITAIKIVGGEGQSIKNLTVHCSVLNRTTYDIDITNPTKTVLEDVTVNLASGTNAAGGIYFHKDTGQPGNAFMPELSRVWIRNGHLVAVSVTDGHFVDGYVWGTDSAARATVDLNNCPAWSFADVDIVPTFGSGAGYRLENCNHVKINGGYLDGSYNANPTGHGLLAINSGRIFVVGTNFYNLGLSGIRLQGTNGCSFSAIGFYSNNKQNVSAPDIDIYSSSYNTFLGMSHSQPVAQSNAGLIFHEDNLSSNNLLDDSVLDQSNGNFYTAGTFIGNVGTLGRNNRPASLWPHTNDSAGGPLGLTEDIGRKPYDFTAGVAKSVATIIGGGNYSSFLLEIEMTARDPNSGACYIVAKRMVLTNNGAPLLTTIGTDATALASFALTASGTSGVALSITTTGAVFATVIVRAAAGGASASTNPRGVTVLML